MEPTRQTRPTKRADLGSGKAAYELATAEACAVWSGWLTNGAHTSVSHGEVRCAVSDPSYTTTRERHVGIRARRGAPSVSAWWAPPVGSVA
jgi:hypothetical protein